MTGGSLLSDAKAASLVEEARRAGLQPKLSPGSATGYAGVGLVKGKYQARFYDKAKKRIRAVPGLHKTALEAALALAWAKHLVKAMVEEGEACVYAQSCIVYQLFDCLIRHARRPRTLPGHRPTATPTRTQLKVPSRTRCTSCSRRAESSYGEDITALLPKGKAVSMCYHSGKLLIKHVRQQCTPVHNRLPRVCP